jgi:hypothetical protein
MDIGRARLIEAEQFHLLLLDGLERMAERWARRQADEVAASGSTSSDG